MSQMHKRPGGSQRPNERTVDYLCKPKFTNSLPDIPFDGKFLACPFVPLDRFVDYKPSLLEKEYKFEVQCEMDMGVNIDLIDPETYKVEPKRPVQINEKDQILLEDESSNALLSRRSAQHSKVVPWMRKTEYISSEFNRFGICADRQEIKVGYHLKKNMENDNMYRDRQSQIDAINKTFDDTPIQKHYSKKGVTAVEELPVFPDFELWKYPFAQVIFDADPSVLSVPESLRRTVMEQSQIKGMQDDQGEQFVAYFSPTVETLQQRLTDKEEGRCYEEGTVYEYILNREYNWTVKNKASKGYEQDNFFLYMKDGNMYYNELETRVRLTRRRKAGQGKPNSRLHVTHCDPTEAEIEQMTSRLQGLLRPYDQKEDEDMEQDDEDIKSEKSGNDEKEADVKMNESDKTDDSDSEKGSDSDKSDNDVLGRSDEDDKKSSANSSDEDSD
uniref:RNA polymerase II-associated factor 1 homolog n=1 Tax=Heterorhabditis bacteriophora TaxID=37862 RepID=A0A1I7XL35_HETBA